MSLTLAKPVVCDLTKLTVTGASPGGLHNCRLKLRVHLDSAADLEGLHDAEQGAMDALHDFSAELNAEDETNKASFALKLKRSFVNAMYRFDADLENENVTALGEIKNALTAKAVHGKLFVELDLFVVLASDKLVALARKVGKDGGCTLGIISVQMSLLDTATESAETPAH